MKKLIILFFLMMMLSACGEAPHYCVYPEGFSGQTTISLVGYPEVINGFIMFTQRGPHGFPNSGIDIFNCPYDTCVYVLGHCPENNSSERN